MKHTPKKAIGIIVATAGAFITLGVVIGGAAPGFHWHDEAPLSLSSQEKKGVDLLNKRFGVVRISSVIDGKMIGSATPNRLMADVLTTDVESSDVKSEVLLKSRSGELMLLESRFEDAEDEMISAYQRLWNIAHAEKNQAGELFQDPASDNVKSLSMLPFSDAKSDNAPVLVAVIDSGIDDHHPALERGVWHNAAEESGQLGHDDDRNGKVDDLEGWDFVNNSADIKDTVGHGTHVTGVIAAHPTFLSEMQGVNPEGTEVMVLKVADDKHGLKLSNVIAALHYAEEKGADVINLSLGFPDDSKIFHDAIKELKAKGIYLIAAAGNNADSAKQYPAAYPEVLSVGSANIDGGRWRTSNFGEWVDINVPGKLLSTLPDSRYGTKSGTSQAAALITGLYSYYKYQYPELDDEAIEVAITEFAHSFEADAQLAATTLTNTNDDWIVPTANTLKSGRFPDSSEIDRWNLQKVMTDEDANVFLLEYFGVRSDVIETIRDGRQAPVTLVAAPNQLLERYLHPAAEIADTPQTKSFLSSRQAIELLLQIEQKIYSEVRTDSPLLLYLNSDAPYISREKFADLVFQAFAQS